MQKLISNKLCLKGTIYIDGDKSISHRAIIIGSIAKGKTTINNFLKSEDCLNTAKCLKKLGVKIKIKNKTVIIYGKGLYKFRKPNKDLYVGNSGTTIRLLSGLLSAQKFSCKIYGDESIQNRPMDRIIMPLNKMGANISGINNKYPPLSIKKGNIQYINYTLPIPSAQIKSSLLLAGLYGKNKTVINEPIISRNHTEIMLNYFGANILRNNSKIILTPPKNLYAKNITIPGDISSASFFIVAALICKNSFLKIKNVGLNPTRTGIITILKKMGANINIKNISTVNDETIGDIEVKTSLLKATIIEKDIIPRLIDEIPIISVCALFAKGKTIIRNAEELKFKETNRIKCMISELKKLGAKIKETNDGMIIQGDQLLHSSTVSSNNDHRIAMSLSIAALNIMGTTCIENVECINTSFPNFFNILEKL